WSARLMMHSTVIRPIRSLLAWVACVFLFAGFLALLPSPSSWPLVAGLGGQAGDVLKDAFLTVLTLGLKAVFAVFVAGLTFALGAVLFAATATGIGRGETGLVTRIFGDRLSDVILASAGAVHHAYLGWRARSTLKRRTPEPASFEETHPARP